MANIKELYAVANETAGIASGIIRNLNFSLIAVIWILSHENINEVRAYYFAIAAILFSQFLDLSQYIWKASAIHRFAHTVEDTTSSEDRQTKDFLYPRYIHRITNALFYSKIVLTLLAVLYLLTLFICPCLFQR